MAHNAASRRQLFCGGIAAMLKIIATFECTLNRFTL